MRARMPMLLLLVACVTNVGAAISASLVPAAACDLTLHGQMVESALLALTEQGWTAFQDPWLPDLNGGFALFHVYPHFSHQVTALAVALFGLDAWTALSAGCFLVVFALPLLVYCGARTLGFGRWASALAALFLATMRSADAWGHAPIEYGFIDGRGMYAQLWGMGIATMALPAWVAACAPDGAGMSRIPRASRLLVAALLLSILLRTHLPSAWVVLLVTPVIVMLWGPLRELAGRLLRLAGVGAAAIALSLGFLLPFIRDLDAVSNAVLEPRNVTASVGAVEVMHRLMRGDYLDGGGVGPWTLVFVGVVALVVCQIALPRFRRAADPRLVALGAAIALSLALLFGRETWGDWVESVPMFGRFMDHRYLLGLHLLAPWFVALGCVQLAERVHRERPRAAVAAGLIVVFLSVLFQIRVEVDDLQTSAEHRSLLGAFEQELEPIITEAKARPFEPVVLGGASPEPAGVDAMELLQHSGVSVRGTPSHTYAYVGEFTSYWSAWMAGVADLRDGPIRQADLRAAAASRLLLPPERPSGSAAETPPGRGWSIHDLAPTPEQFGDVLLVRSDLLYNSPAQTLDGFSIAWFHSGAHLVRQHPTIAVGRYAVETTERYARVAQSTDRDPTVLDGLPVALALGEIIEVGRGGGPFDRRVVVESTDPNTWLLVGIAWHPGWRALVDGQDWPVRMLCPGFLGVQLPPGHSEVELLWTVPAWRGVWAASNTALCLAIAGFVVMTAVRPRRRDG